MQVAARGAIRQPVSVRTVVSTVALVLVVAVIVLVVWTRFTPNTTALPPVLTTAPTSVPGNYRLPSEPVNYDDPNYIGSYGG
jgi:hypothetical protein